MLTKWSDTGVFFPESIPAIVSTSKQNLRYTNVFWYSYRWAIWAGTRFHKCYQDVQIHIIDNDWTNKKKKKKKKKKGKTKLKGLLKENSEKFISNETKHIIAVKWSHNVV